MASLATGLLAVLIYRSIDFNKLPMPCVLPLADVPPAKYAVPHPWTGKFAMNNELQKSIRLFEGKIAGSESVAVAKSGDQVYLIDREGYLKIAHGNPAEPTSLELEPSARAYLGPGRPLGFHLEDNGDLLTCNCILGLTRLRRGAGFQEVLANGVPLGNGSYADDLDVAPNGDIYFSDASAIQSALNRAGHYDALRSSILTMLQGTPSGRLLRWRAATGETEVLATGLWFPNGVALAADASFLMLAETTSGKMLKYHIEGPRAGQLEVLIDSLPGYPDGVSLAPDGNFWAAVFSEHAPLLNLGRPLAQGALGPGLALRRMGIAIKFDAEGNVLKTLVDPDGTKVSAVTAITEHEGWLYLGTLVNNFVGAYKL
ncbi:hypothetical protein QBZ16_004788 [Prototheca wickerhamii]|uniref:Strictosidine synthase conserved region domain-containing protein n=1 Tax=Prototheca wickerhamii TaxID=3111 RepID=A0AAD9IHC6_PROWI|nr:hypothetical protein QBZ16_004788 [Prototheca wickerhamii]